LEVVVYKVLVGVDIGPVVIMHIHLLTTAIIHSSKYVDVVVEVGGLVEESSVRHRG
jgi:hypothetical protein